MKLKRKLLVIIVTFTILLTVVYNTSLGRYIMNKVNNYILESKNFYFDSTILSVDNSMYNISNWDGVNAYTLTIDVNSKKNELVSSSYDIEYDIEVDCPSSVTCSLDKNSGIIYENSKIDTYVITVTPVTNFNIGDQVIITTSAISTEPYAKTLSATYNIGVENYGFSYDILDSVGSKYLTLELTNSKPYYNVIEAFDTYIIGDNISVDIYNSLSDINKDKCMSARVTMDFDPNDILLDLNSEAYIDNLSYDTRVINTFNYIDSLVIDIAASSNTKINFYKTDVSSDYTSSQIINVSVQN